MVTTETKVWKMDVNGAEVELTILITRCVCFYMRCSSAARNTANWLFFAPIRHQNIWSVKNKWANGYKERFLSLFSFCNFWKFSSSKKERILLVFLITMLAHIIKRSHLRSITVGVLFAPRRYRLKDQASNFAAVDTIMEHFKTKFKHSKAAWINEL